jgi:hypothetical protein
VQSELTKELRAQLEPRGSGGAVKVLAVKENTKRKERPSVYGSNWILAAVVVQGWIRAKNRARMAISLDPVKRARSRRQSNMHDGGLGSVDAMVGVARLHLMLR